jgi:hypothetical protein
MYGINPNPQNIFSFAIDELTHFIEENEFVNIFYGTGL